MNHNPFSKIFFAIGVFIFSLLCANVCFGQLKAGIKVNGDERKSGDTLKICKGTTVTYTSSATGVADNNIIWNFKNGNPPSYTGKTIAVTYNNTGIDKTIQYVSEGTKKDSAFIYVKVTDSYPKADFKFDPPGTTCGSETITFTSASTGQVAAYAWNFGDNTTSKTNPATHKFTNAIGNDQQTYPVKLVVTNDGGCADSVSKNVQVKEIPDASLGNADVNVSLIDFNGVPTFSKCDNIGAYTFSFKNITTTAATNTGYTIKWGDGSLDSSFTTWNTGTVITHPFLRGNTPLTLEVTGKDGCTASKQYNVFVGTTPKVGLSNLGNSVICQGESLQFRVNDVTDNTAGTFYTFHISDGTPDQTYDTLPPEYINHAFNTSSCGYNSLSYTNSFYAQLTAINSCASAKATVEPIYVSGKAKAQITNYPGSVACVNATVTLYNTSNLGGVIQGTQCVSKGLQVWTISPSTGYTITGGNLGSTHDNPINWALWDNGSPTLDIKFTAAGTYTIKIYVTNQSSCGGGIDSMQETICIRNPPQASFLLSKPKACDEAVINLKNTSVTGTCTGDSYQWNISATDPSDCSASSIYAYTNGSSYTSVSPDVKFTGAGSYNVVLTAYALNAGYGCAPSSHTETVVIKSKPKVAIDVLPVVCISNSLSLTATVTNCYADSALKYNWTFLNGTPDTSTMSSPKNIQYAAVGVYPVSVDVANECGTATDQKNVTIIAQPVANAGSDTAICSGSTITLGAAAQNGLSYKWSPSTGLSDITSASPLLTLTYNGNNNDTTYQYILVASAGISCSANDTVYVKVKKSPLVKINPDNASMCSSGTAQLTASGAETYTWLPAAGLNNTNTAVVIASPSVTTLYSVTGALANGCTGTSAITVTVQPDAKALFTAVKTTGCIDFKLKDVVAVTPYPEQNDTYYWYANDVLIASNTTGAFPDYAITTPGETVTIKLVTTSKYGCKADSMQQDFTASLSAKAIFTTDIKRGCGSLPVHVTNTSTTLNNVLFTWNFGNGVITNDVQPGLITFNSSAYNNDTTYYITLTADDGCSITIWKDSVFVSANPKARFGVDSTFGCSPYYFTLTNTSLGAPDIYYWDYGDGTRDTTASAEPIKHSYLTGTLDTFHISLIAENKCARDTQAVDVVVVPNPIKPQINISGSEANGCSPHTVYFNNNTTGATKYTWNFGDGQPPLITTDNQTIVAHTYQQPGNFSIRIDITNGCSDTSVYTSVTVYEKPAASFSLSKAAACEKDTVQVAATTQNADAYRWDWNDGTISSGSSATHIYANPGTYTVTLYADRINNVGIVCSDISQKTVTIVGKPNTLITANNNAVNCAPFSFIASAPGITAESIQWSVTDSTTKAVVNTATSNNINYIFSDAGTYYIKLNAVNATGCNASDSIKLKVFEKPISAFTPLVSTTCSIDTTIAFTNSTTYSGSDAVRYSWAVNSQPLSSNKNFSYRFTASANEQLPKTFTTWLIAKNSIGCSDTVTGSLTMNPSAKAIFSITNPATCVPFYTNISNTSTDASQYNWLLNNAYTSTAQNPALLLDKASTPYALQLIASNNYCKPDTASYTFTTLAKPTASFALNDTLGCAGSLNIIPANTTTGANRYTWIWGDNTPNSNLPAPTHLYNTMGRFTITLIATDGTCEDTVAQYAAVETKPVTDFAASNTIGCDTVDVQFTNLSTGARTFIWRFGDNTTGTDVNPFKRYAPSTMPYSVTLVSVGMYGCRDSAVKPNLITTFPSPKADFTVYPSTIINVPDYTLKFVNTTLDLPDYRYVWDMGDNTRFATRDINNYRYQDTGSYTVRLIVNDVSNSCIDTASVLMKINGIPGWLYVPNTFCPRCIQQELRTFLPTGKGLKTYDLQIFTTWGQLVFHTNALDATGVPKEGWDGSDKGKAVQQDVYIWKITATFLNGTEWMGMKYPYSNAYKREGTITIIK